VKSASEIAVPAWRVPAIWQKTADIVAVLLALTLPWSTSAVGILGAVFSIVILPTLDIPRFLQSLKRPISALPIAIFLVAVVGVLWSDAPWSELNKSLSSSVKFLVLPLLLYHFERSTRGTWVFIAFLVSCALLMVVSWVVLAHPSLTLTRVDPPEPGIFVKNYIDQSQEFALCTVTLGFPAVMFLQQGKRWQAVGLIALAISFVVNMAFVVVSRTAIVTMPIMLAIFAMMHLTWRINLALFSMAILLAVLAWLTSPQLQTSIERFASDYRIYMERNEATSIGLRLEFFRKSLHFFSEAPVAGHGTGSTRGLFEAAATGPAVLAQGQVIGNPHNQTLNVAVQWGILGVIVLYATWIFHFLLFRGEGLAAWIGLMVVLQNIMTSLFNSHLFDFHEGWMYVVGVGVAGGIVLKARPVVTAAVAAGS
jgi:O-antigen ligase